MKTTNKVISTASFSSESNCRSWWAGVRQVWLVSAIDVTPSLTHTLEFNLLCTRTSTTFLSIWMTEPSLSHGNYFVFLHQVLIRIDDADALMLKHQPIIVYNPDLRVVFNLTNAIRNDYSWGECYLDLKLLFVWIESCCPHVSAFLQNVIKFLDPFLQFVDYTTCVTIIFPFVTYKRPEWK